MDITIKTVLNEYELNCIRIWLQSPNKFRNSECIMLMDRLKWYTENKRDYLINRCRACSLAFPKLNGQYRYLLPKSASKFRYVNIPRYREWITEHGCPCISELYTEDEVVKGFENLIEKYKDKL